MPTALITWHELFSDFFKLNYLDSKTLLPKEWFESPAQMGEDTSYWVVAALLFIFIISLIHYTFPDQSRRVLDWTTRNLFPIALVVWIAGVWIYMIGLYDVRLNGWGVAPRAMIASFRMFLASNELARINEAFRTNAQYMALFSCVHFTATVIAFLFLIKLTGFRLWAMVNLLLKSPWRRSETHIFWGINDESITLAKNIRKHENKKRLRKSLIVFVNTNDIHDKAQGGSIGMNNILDLISLRNKDIDNILEIKNTVVTNCHLELSSAKELKGGKFFKALNMRSLNRIIKRSQKIRFFLLSDDEEKNILSAVKLRNALSEMTEKKEITLYAHARKGRKNEIYNYYSLFDAGCQKEQAETTNCSIKIKLIDSSNLAVTYLKQHFEHHPIHLVDIDAATATVTSPFNALIIGFGEVGRDAFRFLYEFGAFIAPDGKRSPFHCHAIDANMDQIEGAYRAATTDIVGKSLTLVHTAIGSESYYKTLNEIIGTLNYIVITINDDDLALATAVRLYRQAMQQRGNALNHFRIYVHCRETSHLKRMKEVAEKLNMCNKASGGRIIIFGDKQELYTYDMIIDNKIEQEAKLYHKQYKLTEPIFLSKKEQQAGTTEEQKRKDIRDTNVDTLWNESFEADCIQKNGGATLALIQEMIRQREQNMANTLHKETKALLLGTQTGDCEALREWVEIIKTREIGKTTYKLPMEENQPLSDEEKATKEAKETRINLRLTNVARCEHIRWEASHQLMGYSHDTQKDPIRKTHPDMRPMEKLSTLTQSYDYNVVDTSLRLLYEEACQNNPQHNQKVE